MKSFSFPLLLATIFALLFHTTGWGQKHCDLALRVVSPAQGADIPYGDTLKMYVSVKNLGPDTIDSSDAFYLYMDAIPWPTYFSNISIPVGDSGIFNTYIAVSGQVDTDFHFVLCSYLETADSSIFLDDNSANDSACMDVTFKAKNNTGISGSNHDELSVQLYPNPSNGAVSLRINLGSKQQLTAWVQNWLGQTVIREEIEAGKGSSVYSLNLTDVSPGVYFVKIVNPMGGFWIGKVVIK